MGDTILVNQEEIRLITNKLRGKKKAADTFLNGLSKEIESAHEFFEGESFEAYESEFNELKSHIQKSLYECLDNIAGAIEKTTGLLIEADKQEANNMNNNPVFAKGGSPICKVGSDVKPAGNSGSKVNDGFSVTDTLGKVFGPSKANEGAVASGSHVFKPFNAATVTTEGQLLGYSANIKHNVGFDLEKGLVGASITGKAEGYVAKGEVKSEIGLASVTLGGAALTGSVSGEAKAILFEGGKLDPQLKLRAAAEAVGLKGTIDQRFGNDQFNIHQGAEGKVGDASAEAYAVVGKDGIGVGAGADAAVFKGEVKQGFTLFGVNIDVSAQGEALAVGAEAKFGVDKESFELGGKLSALAGLGLNLKISW